MTLALDKTIQDIQELTPSEKGLVAQYLISSLDSIQDVGAEHGWAELAKSRFESLEKGEVQAVEWDSIKKQIFGI
jgi:hypothetical protein